jgi:hypothetical protein
MDEKRALCHKKLSRPSPYLHSNAEVDETIHFSQQIEPISCHQTLNKHNEEQSMTLFPLRFPPECD